jgi:hypothetical protein
MKRLLLIISSVILLIHSGLGQVKDNSEFRILFRGLVIDATTLSPISNSQIMINNSFSSLSREDGSFSFYVNKFDTVVFRSLGYKQSVMYISDTLKGREFISGIFMNNDTVSIGEVIIMPGYSNLKSEILNAKSELPANMENARYNVAVSAYQGKNSQAVLGDPENNYNVISQRQKINAFEKGGIASEHIVGFNPLIFLPAAYILLHGLPEKAPPLAPELTNDEVEKINKRYLESVRKLK